MDSYWELMDLRHRHQGKLILTEPVVSEIQDPHCLLEQLERCQNSHQWSYVSFSPCSECGYLETETILTSLFFTRQFLHAAPKEAQLK